MLNAFAPAALAGGALGGAEADEIIDGKADVVEDYV